MRKIILILFISMVGIIYMSDAPVAGSPNINCDQSLWDHVWGENSAKTFRLQLVNPCIMVTGTITKVFQSGPPPDNGSDGDWHVNIRLDSQYSNLLRKNNLKYQNGDLVTEVICAYPPEYDPAVDACQGFDQSYLMKNVAVGNHVQIIGAYVIDIGEGDIDDNVPNNWAEIHPITSIVKIPVQIPIPIKGDINQDGKITIADSLLYLRFALGQDISPFHIDPTKDDVTCDGKITVADALKVLRKAVGQNVDLTTC